MTNDEIQQLNKLLGKCQPGILPVGVFTNLARLTVLVAVEFIPLRRVKNSVEVLLIKRPSNDPFWPGMLHTPGTILRPTDISFSDAFERLFREEIGINSSPELLFNGFKFGHGDRGSSVGFEYVLSLDQRPKNGDYFPVNKLLTSLIQEQKGLIERAVKVFTD